MNKKPVRNVNRWNGKEESAGDCSGGIPPGSGACVRQAPRGRKEKGEGRASSRCPLGSIWRPVRDAGEGDGAAPLEEIGFPWDLQLSGNKKKKPTKRGNLKESKKP